ncbi:hypothetical protein [Salinithrix halophila]|uniref:Holin n=1 Tax=Salinithrix halophila TaxID=1485204 RepID=A0ABV8JKU2_9BACL
MSQQIFGVALVPLIVGLVELTKLWGLSSKWAAVLSVALGWGAGIFLVSPGDWVQGTVIGLAMGLSAAGLYSGSKSVLKGVTERRRRKGRRDKPDRKLGA